MHSKNYTTFAGNLTSHQEIYEEMSNFAAGVNMNLAKYFYT